MRNIPKKLGETGFFTAGFLRAFIEISKSISGYRNLFFTEASPRTSAPWNII